jgi:hypothetical protein
MITYTENHTNRNSSKTSWQYFWRLK